MTLAAEEKSVAVCDWALLTWILQSTWLSNAKKALELDFGSCFVAGPEQQLLVELTDFTPWLEVLTSKTVAPAGLYSPGEDISSKKYLWIGLSCLWWTFLLSDWLVSISFVINGVAIKSGFSVVWGICWAKGLHCRKRKGRIMYLKDSPISASSTGLIPILHANFDICHDDFIHGVHVENADSQHHWLNGPMHKSQATESSDSWNCRSLWL